MSDEQAALAAEIQAYIDHDADLECGSCRTSQYPPIADELAARLIAAGWWRYEDNFKVTLITVGPNAWVERDGQWMLVPRAPADEGDGDE